MGIQTIEYLCCTNLKQINLALAFLNELFKITQRNWRVEIWSCVRWERSQVNSSEGINLNLHWAFLDFNETFVLRNFKTKTFRKRNLLLTYKQRLFLAQSTPLSTLWKGEQRYQIWYSLHWNFWQFESIASSWQSNDCPVSYAVCHAPKSNFASWQV